MNIRIGINGFGRIGRNLLRASIKDSEMDFVAVNDITDAKTLAHLLKYDSVLGTFKEDVKATADSIIVNGKTIKVLAEKEVGKLPWKDLGVSVVVESTGRFTKRPDVIKHIQDGGAKKVIVSAPATDPDLTVVMGVNEKDYDAAKHNILSNASCTTNCLAPVAKVLHEEFVIEKAFMTTIHSYTNDQVLTDVFHKDLRRARSATMSMIPTKTGAAAAVGLVLPELNGKLDGFAMRVPTINVSVVDLTFEAARPTSKDEVNAILKDAAQGELKGILAYNEEPLVSIDFNHTAVSSTYDAGLTKVIDGKLVKVLSWYDNEWGFCNRMLDTTVALMNAK